VSSKQCALTDLPATAIFRMQYAATKTLQDL
jgi:hypothetical protein